MLFRLVKLRGKVADDSFESDSSDSDSSGGGRIEPENEDRPRSHRLHPLLCLAKTDKISKEIRSLERDVWLIEGVLKHDIRRELLELIYNKFERIDCVPAGYHYPEFYMLEGR